MPVATRACQMRVGMPLCFACSHFGSAFRPRARASQAQPQESAQTPRAACSQETPNFLRKL
eukprot:13494852-Alexandrium_andersonii.AAC.1